MTGRIITCDHSTWQLPPLLDWEITCTGGVPCDSFSATVSYDAALGDKLHKAVSFLAMERGRLLLHGIVDEYVIRQDETGRTATLHGRGYACRLLDNEARPMTYQQATTAEILRNHVTPYGITCAQADDLTASSVYTVTAGSSQWRAVEAFCQTYGNFTPRFDRAGNLRMTKRNDGRTLQVDDRTAILAMTKRENHYGVLSEVLVIDKTRNASYSVKNTEFQSRGGQRRQVVYTPGQSTWAAMRYTGEYQIARSKENEVTLEVTLPGLVEADAGDTVRLSRSDCGLAGVYRAAAVTHRCGEDGEETVLELKEGN